MKEHTREETIGLALAIVKNIVEMTDSLYEAEVVAYWVNREISLISMKTAIDGISQIEKEMAGSTVIKPDLN